MSSKAAVAAIASQRNAVLATQLSLAREHAKSYDSNNEDEEERRNSTSRSRARSTSSDKGRLSLDSPSGKGASGKGTGKGAKGVRRSSYGTLMDMFDDQSVDSTNDGDGDGDGNDMRMVDDDTDEDDEEDFENAVTSFRDMLFTSEDAKLGIKLHFAMDTSKKKFKTQRYDRRKVFPDWMVKDPSWSVSSSMSTGMHIAHILQMKENERTSGQVGFHAFFVSFSFMSYSIDIILRIFLLLTFLTHFAFFLSLNRLRI